VCGFVPNDKNPLKDLRNHANRVFHEDILFDNLHSDGGEEKVESQVNEDEPSATSINGLYLARNLTQREVDKANCVAVVMDSIMICTCCEAVIYVCFYLYIYISIQSTSHISLIYTLIEPK